MCQHESSSREWKPVVAFYFGAFMFHTFSLFFLTFTFSTLCGDHGDYASNGPRIERDT
jgi:hypothetical protein